MNFTVFIDHSKDLGDNSFDMSLVIDRYVTNKTNPELKLNDKWKLLSQTDVVSVYSL